MQKLLRSHLSLREVPRILLDKSRYGAIGAVAKSESQILQILNAPRPDQSSDGFWDAVSDCEVQQQRLWQCGRELCLEFRNLFRGRKIACFGYPPASAERIMIPPDRDDFWPRFLMEVIIGRDIEFTKVIVVDDRRLSSPRQERFHAAERFIQTAFALGNPLEKGFKFDVRQKFPDLRCREIDVLFANISGRKKGAPNRKNRRIKK